MNLLPILVLYLKNHVTIVLILTLTLKIASKNPSYAVSSWRWVTAPTSTDANLHMAPSNCSRISRQTTNIRQSNAKTSIRSGFVSTETDAISFIRLVLSREGRRKGVLALN